MTRRGRRVATAEPAKARPLGSDADTDWDELTTALIDLGVLHVAPGRKLRTTLVDSVSTLFDRLTASREARLQQASILLLLTHPEMAGAARAAIDRMPLGLRERAMRRYTAAAAMQRMARTRIAMQLGPQPDLPSVYLDDLGLPALDEEFGRATLAALAQQEEDLYGYDAWGTYSALLDLFLSEIRKSGWGTVCVNEPTAPAEVAVAVHTTYTEARANLAALLNRATQDRETVIISRRGADDVALIAADELASLLETAHLLRSPANAARLLTALGRALANTEEPQSLVDLKREAELADEA